MAPAAAALGAPDAGGEGLRSWQLWRREPVVDVPGVFTMELHGGLEPGAPGKFLAADARGGGVHLVADSGDALARWRFTPAPPCGTPPVEPFFISSASGRDLTVGETLGGWDPAANSRVFLCATGSGRLELFGVNDGGARQLWDVEEVCAAECTVRLRCADAREDGRQYLSASSRGGCVDLWAALDLARAPLWRAPEPAPARAGWRGSLFAIQAPSGEFLAPTGVGTLVLQQEEALWRVARYLKFNDKSQCYTVATQPISTYVHYLQRAEEEGYSSPVRAELGLELELNGRQMWVIEGGEGGKVTLRALSQSTWTRGGSTLPRRPAYLNTALQLGALGADSQWAFLSRTPQPARLLRDWDRSPGVQLVSAYRQKPFSEEEVSSFGEDAGLRGAVGFDGAAPVFAL